MITFEKPFYRSKKFIALAMLVVMTSSLISAGIIWGVSPDVLQSMVTILGGTTGAAGAGYIGTQGYVDAKVRPALLETELIEKEEIIEKPED